MKYFFMSLVLFSMVACISNKKLYWPMAGGHFLPSTNRVVIHTDNALFFVPGEDLQVRSAEAAIVDEATYFDSVYYVRIKGNYEIDYGNLATCDIKKGQKIAKGQVIGRLSQGTINGDLLQMRVKKDKEFVTDTSIFRQ